MFGWIGTAVEETRSDDHNPVMQLEWPFDWCAFCLTVTSRQVVYEAERVILA